MVVGCWNLAFLLQTFIAVEVLFGSASPTKRYHELEYFMWAGS